MSSPPVLPLRELGATGLRVHPLSVGCAALGDMPETFGYSVGEEAALSTLRAIFDGPINFVDTAASYGDGESERRIGVVLRERGGIPPGFVLATKADRNLQTGDFTGEQVQRSIDRSLSLLGVDRLQLAYLHDPEHTTLEAAMAPGGPVDVLRRYRDEGVIQHIGVAGGPIDMMIRYVRTGVFEVAISHNRYTLLDRSADAFWDACRDSGVAAVNGAPYGSGILAKGPRAYPRYAYQQAGGSVLARAHALEEICVCNDIPLAAAAIQFSLRDTRIASTVVGITKPERLQQTVDLATLTIPDTVWDEIESVPWINNDSRVERLP